MGLCKCPKRQVTNQFCFEHRVNVCEHCMVTSHPKCVVQSYLQWLKDSDYDSACTLCSTALEQGDCVRLICYHVFHWDCLNARAAAQPAHTAPGGHTCPACAKHVFPPANLISPVADVLRQRLGAVNWGRSELGLPLLAAGEEHFATPAIPKLQQPEQQSVAHIHNSGHSVPSVRTTPAALVSSKHHNGDGAVLAPLTTSTATGGPHSVLNMDAYDGGASTSGSRRPLLPRERPIGASDSDDNKYAKRSPTELLRRWSRRFYAPSSRPPWRRTWFLVASGLLAFFFFVYVMAVLGRGSYNAANDSQFGAAQSHM